MNRAEVIKQAEQAVTESGVADEFRVPAFTELLRAALAGSPSTTHAAASDGDSGGGEASPLARLAAKVQIDAEFLADVYGEGADGLELRVPASRLATSKKAATGQIALLVAAANEIGGREYTPINDVRNVCSTYARYDGPNFATAVRGLGDAIGTRGKGSALEIRLTRPGWEEVTRLIGALADAAVAR